MYLVPWNSSCLTLLLQYLDTTTQYMERRFIFNHWSATVLPWEKGAHILWYWVVKVRRYIGEAVHLMQFMAQPVPGSLAMAEWPSCARFLTYNKWNMWHILWWWYTSAISNLPSTSFSLLSLPFFPWTREEKMSKGTLLLLKNWKSEQILIAFVDNALILSDKRGTYANPVPQKKSILAKCPLLHPVMYHAQ